MRLDEQEKKALKKSLQNIKGEFFIFGSRLEDNCKGGDIDLLVFAQGDPYKISQEITVSFFKECEGKIDVIVMDKSNLSEQQQAFINSIRMEKLSV